MDGEIGFSSQEGVGTQFNIVIPLNIPKVQEQHKKITRKNIKSWSIIHSSGG